MSKQKKAHQPETTSTAGGMSLAGLLSAAVVVVIFVALAVMLSTRSQELAAEQQQQIAEATAARVAEEQPADDVDETSEITDTAEMTSTMELAEEVNVEEFMEGMEPMAKTNDGPRKTYTERPPMTIDPQKKYAAVITTPRGDITVRLRPDVAPQTVNSFVFLAREGFYNGTTWHRVIPNFMAQGGDPTGTGTGGPGYSVPAEFTDKILFDRPGILAMARSSDPNSAGSQFFITNAPAPHLNNQYTPFGEVIDGLDVVMGIPVRDPGSATQPGEEIVNITIQEETA